MVALCTKRYSEMQNYKLEREIKNRADCVKSNEEAVVVSKKKKK
jgi:hypothetical protein